MDAALVDLSLAARAVLVIGRGSEVGIRAKQLLAEGAKVSVLSDDPKTKFWQAIEENESIQVRPGDLCKWKNSLDQVRPFLAVIATGDFDEDQKIAEYARSVAKLVYVVDRPQLNDLNMSGIARLGDIRVAVSTQGLSPAMTGLLRRKIESLISPEDILQVKLQGEIRSMLKKSIKDLGHRKKLVYKLIRNKKITSLLKSNRFEDAKLYALSLITKNSEVG